MVDQNGENLSVFQNLKLHFIQIDIFFAGVHWVIYSIKWELKQNQKLTLWVLYSKVYYQNSDYNVCALLATCANYVKTNAPNLRNIH